MLRAAIVIYLLMSLITFVVYALDKRASGRGLRRTPERTLHLLDLLCGWPGGLAGVYLLRHKSAKLRFKVILWATVIAHAGGLACLWLRK